MHPTLELVDSLSASLRQISPFGDTAAVKPEIGKVRSLDVAPISAMTGDLSTLLSGIDPTRHPVLGSGDDA